MAMDLGKAFRFGAVGGVVLYLLSGIISLIFGQNVAKIQFALIKTPLTAQIGIPSMGLGTKMVAAITGMIGISQPGWIVSLLTVIVGGGVAVVLGRIVYEFVKKLWTPKGQTGRLAMLLFLSGIVGGLIISWGTGLPAFGTALTLAISALVTAYVLVWLLNIKAMPKFISGSKITL